MTRPIIRPALILVTILSVIGLAVGCGGSDKKTDGTTTGQSKTTAADSKTELSWLFTLLADSATAHKDTLTLSNADDDVVLFADAPARSISRMSVAEFVGRWTKLFGKQKPNALISWDTGKGEATAVVELEKPTRDGSTVRFGYRDLDKAPERIASLTRLNKTQKPSDSMTDVRLFIDNATYDDSPPKTPTGAVAMTLEICGFQKTKCQVPPATVINAINGLNGITLFAPDDSTDGVPVHVYDDGTVFVPEDAGTASAMYIFDCSQTGLSLTFWEALSAWAMPIWGGLTNGCPGDPSEVAATTSSQALLARPETSSSGSVPVKDGGTLYSYWWPEGEAYATNCRNVEVPGKWTWEVQYSSYTANACFPPGQ